MTTRASSSPIDLNALSLPELFRALTRDGLTQRLLELARDEDLGTNGDVTSEVSIPLDRRAIARATSRARGTAAGLAAIPELLSVFRARCDFAPAHNDGDSISPSTTLGTLSGNLRDILTVERTLLNVLGRLSGIATRAAQFVSAMGSDTRAKLYDTRKTTPGLRALEKYAVRCGGAYCHRVGLHDAVLLKDNHLASVRDEDLGTHVARAAQHARERYPNQLRFIEVEVDTIAQLRSILSAQSTALPMARVNIVLLDNMNPSQLAECVSLRDRLTPRIELEASGGVSLAAVRDVALTGVDRISTGSLTHGAVWLDIGLDIEPTV